MRKVVLPHLVKLGDVGIAVTEQGSLVLKNFHDFKCGGFADIVDVFLVSDSKDQDFGTSDGFCAVVQAAPQALDDIMRNPSVDFAGQLE